MSVKKWRICLWHYPLVNIVIDLCSGNLLFVCDGNYSPCLGPDSSAITFVICADADTLRPRHLPRNLPHFYSGYAGCVNQRSVAVRAFLMNNPIVFWDLNTTNMKDYL